MKIRTLGYVSPMALIWLASCAAPEGGGEGGAMLEQQLTGSDLTPKAAANVSSLWPSDRADENLDEVYDGNVFTKFLLYGKGSTWIQYRMLRPSRIESYDVTSANDEHPRDPSDWTFEGSFDGLIWDVLHTRTSEVFTAFNQTKQYTFGNATPYLFYRLNITRNAGLVNDLQLAEFRIGGSEPAGTVPSAPTVTATVNSNAVELTWPATATTYYVQRMNEEGSGVTQFTTSTPSFTDSNLVPGTSYVYRVQAANGSLRSFPSTSVRATTPAFADDLTDVTARSAYAPSAQYPGPVNEEVTAATDNDPYSKYLTYGHNTTWLQLRTPADAVVTRYSLTSANDAPERDPKSWTLQGSADGSTWVTLDTRTNQGFAARHMKRTYACNPAKQAFAFYRLSISANAGGPDTQLAEWRLLGSTSVALHRPLAPSNVQATRLSGNQIRVAWQDNAQQLNPETSYLVERSTSPTFSANVVAASAGANSNEFRATSLPENTTFYFRVAALNGASAVPEPVSATEPATTGTNTPPPSFPETGWYDGHNRMAYLAQTSGNVSVYFDQHVPNPSSITWLTPIMAAAWTHVRQTYGSFSDPNLLVLGNQDLPGDIYDGGGALFHFNGDLGYRNLVWAASGNWMDSDPLGSNLSMMTHELGHIVEFGNNGVSGSPAYNTEVWGDSKWCEIFQYDLYRYLVSIGVPGIPTDSADRIRDRFLIATDDYGRYWFRDWYYPLYNGSFGNSAADKRGKLLLAKFFQLLAQHFPQKNSAYPRSLNFGEYVHFLSGAAGVDLEDEARVAFGWTPAVELQLGKAQQEFRAVTALYRLANGAPGFTFDPISRSATVGVALAGQTLQGTASDPDLAHTAASLVYSKLSGPSWLAIASNGTLSGTPTATGPNNVQVRVSDPNGASDTATLNLDVLAAPTTSLDDGLETNFNLWTDGGTTNWDRATDQKHGGTYAARCGSSDTTLTSDNLNTGGKQRITISFWYRDSSVDDDDEVYLQLYDGSSYLSRFELGNGAENTWQQYTVTLPASAEPAYFRSNFRIRFEGTSIDSGEFLWIDDVRVTTQ